MEVLKAEVIEVLHGTSAFGPTLLNDLIGCEGPDHKAETGAANHGAGVPAVKNTLEQALRDPKSLAVRRCD